MPIGILTTQVFLHGSTSLKQKRSRLKPMLARLHREFNISVAEVEQLDSWHDSILAICMVSNDSQYTQRSLEKIVEFMNRTWPDNEIVVHRIELI